MLGSTASGLYWMFRYLERAENSSRLIEAGLRMALTRASATDDDWSSVLTTAGVHDAYSRRHDQVAASTVIDFLLRDIDNPSSVATAVSATRNNARAVRTALTRELWEATNQCWLTTSAILRNPVSRSDLPEVLSTIRRESALVRGCLHGTMMRTEKFNFSRLGTYVERADSTARILDVKYYVLLPSVMHVGTSLDNIGWETILRSVSAERAFRWAHPGPVNPAKIAEFLILDTRMPRSLAFCTKGIVENLGHLVRVGEEPPLSHALAERLLDEVEHGSINQIFDVGLHEFLVGFIAKNAAVGAQIERDYRFTG